MVMTRARAAALQMSTQVGLSSPPGSPSQPTGTQSAGSEASVVNKTPQQSSSPVSSPKAREHQITPTKAIEAEAAVVENTIREAETEEHQSPIQTWAPLTRKNLRQLERKGGSTCKCQCKCKAAAVGDVAPVETSSDSDSDSDSMTRTTGTVTTTHSSFPRMLAKQGVIFGRPGLRKSHDFEEMRKLLRAPRDDVSPSAAAYATLCNYTDGHHEVTIATGMWGRLINEPDGDYVSRRDLAWNKCPPTAFSLGLANAKPDYQEGFLPRCYPDEVVDALEGSLIPGGEHSIAIPAFLAEFKSANGNMNVAEAQAAYAGALSVQCALALHTFLHGDGVEQSPPFHDKTQAISVILNGRTMEVYSHFVTRDASDATPRYVQCLLLGNSPDTSEAAMGEAQTVLRNAQDWARRISEERLSAARRWMQTRAKRERETDETGVYGLPHGVLSGIDRAVAATLEIAAALSPPDEPLKKKARLTG